MPLLWSPTESALQSQNLAFSDDSLVSRRIHYRTHSRIHTGLCDSACLQRWCRCKFRSQRCRMHLRQTQRTLNQTNLKKGIKNSAARHGLIKEHSVQLQSRMPLKESVSRANANTHEYSSMLAKHSSQYNSSQFITILCQEHLRPQKDTKRLTWSEDV